jgi:L-lactate dehydrogenase complex protein LldG
VSAAREEILARVQRALGPRRPETAGGHGYRRAGRLDEPACVELFARRVADYRAEVVRSLPALAGTFGVPPGLRAAWRPRGAVEDAVLSVEELDALDGVVTGCTVAVAETGTIVLAGGAEEGRRALTLVPDLHVCVVRTEQIVETVPEAFDRLGPLATRPLTFVSGPSATSDIELKRVEGVHGPRRLVVVIVDG